MNGREEFVRVEAPHCAAAARMLPAGLRPHWQDRSRSGSLHWQVVCACNAESDRVRRAGTMLLHEIPHFLL